MCEVRSSRLLIAASFFDLLAIVIPLLAHSTRALLAPLRLWCPCERVDPWVDTTKYIPYRVTGLTGG